MLINQLGSEHAADRNGSVDFASIAPGMLPPGDIVFDPQYPLAHMPSKVTTGTVVYRDGDKRNFVYRIESGALRLWLARENGASELIEFAFPGDIVGMGFLEHHVGQAEAVLDAVLTPLPVAEVEELAAFDEAVAGRLADAIDLEFSVLRDRAVASGAGKPLERLAAYLLAVASVNAIEHGTGLVVPDSLSCGYVADALGMSIDHLASNLSTLEGRGLVAASPFGLEVRDRAALEKMIA